MNFNTDHIGDAMDVEVTWGINEPEPYQGGGGGEIYSMNLFSWETLAESTVDVLDPYYGEGGILEPVTVIVDEDRTVKEEYIDPILDEYGESLETSMIVAGLIALAVLVK